MLYLMAFGALVGFGAAYETAYESTMYQSMTAYEDEPVYAQQYSSTSESAEMYGGHHDGDHHDGDYHGDYHHGYYDWLSPGGAYYWGYPSYYYSSWYYPTYTYYPTYYTYPTTYYYTYPTYTYSAPVVYDWVADPWWAANVYGIGSTTYYYSSSSSWSYHGGFFFGP